MGRNSTPIDSADLTLSVVVVAGHLVGTIAVIAYYNATTVHLPQPVRSE
jgi:hypothetical protein